MKDAKDSSAQKSPSPDFAYSEKSSTTTNDLTVLTSERGTMISVKNTPNNTVFGSQATIFLDKETTEQLRDFFLGNHAL